MQLLLFVSTKSVVSQCSFAGTEGVGALSPGVVSQKAVFRKGWCLCWLSFRCCISWSHYSVRGKSNQEERNTCTSLLATVSCAPSSLCLALSLIKAD